MPNGTALEGDASAAMNAATSLAMLSLLASALLVLSCGDLAARGAGTAPAADVASPPPGVADRGADPAVVAVDFGGAAPCAGALLAPDVVITALHCVSLSTAATDCASRPDASLDAGGARALRAAASIRVLAGDGAGGLVERARGREIRAPAVPGPGSAPGVSSCDADVAMLLLDQGVAGVAPLAVRATGAARGDHVRSVGLRAGAKVVREHVAVLDSAPTNLEVGEDVMGEGGGPALDEDTAEIVGVASRGDGPGRDVYTRADVFLSLVEGALDDSRSAGGVSSDVAKVEKGPLDMGGACLAGSDCAAGVCVSAPGAVAQYCSRTCGTGDRCPTGFRCVKSAGGAQVCEET